MSRPTVEDLEDPAEIGRCGCLIPDTEPVAWGAPDDDEEEEDEEIPENLPE
jgi:hypothetical protein